MTTENRSISPEAFTGVVLGKALVYLDVEKGKVVCVSIPCIDFEDPDGLNVWTHDGIDELDNRTEIIDHVENQPWPMWEVRRAVE